MMARHDTLKILVRLARELRDTWRIRASLRLVGDDHGTIGVQVGEHPRALVWIESTARGGHAWAHSLAWGQPCERVDEDGAIEIAHQIAMWGSGVGPEWAD